MDGSGGLLFFGSLGNRIPDWGTRIWSGISFFRILGESFLPLMAVVAVFYFQIFSESFSRLGNKGRVGQVFFSGSLANHFLPLMNGSGE